MALNPSISLGVRPLELANPLAQYGQVAALQSAQNQNQLAQYQLGVAQRAEATQNALADAYSQSIDPNTGAINYNKLTGLLAKGGGGSQIPGIEKTRREIEAAALAAQKTKGEIEKNEFQLTKDKLKHGWTSLGDAPTPQDAIKKLNEGVTKGYFDFATASAETQRLQNMTPEQYKQYRVEKVLGLLDAKDKLSFMLPKNVRQEAGGKIITIQDNPMLPGYSQPIAGMDITKTPTFAEQTGQGQLNLARQKFAWEQANPGFELKETEDGSIVGVNKRTLQAFPISIGGVTPAAAPTAPMAGAGMPGARLPAAPVQAIPGMTSVLDQPALTTASAVPAVGTPLRGKGTAPTEGERKAATLLQRLQGSQNQLTQALLDDPKAAGPQAFATAVGKLSTTAANLLNTEARQRVEAAQLDILDAALTLGTGAAYTKEQLEGYRQAYFPAYGDEPKTIADKKARLQNVISAANIAAGKAAKSVATPPPLTLPNARGGVDTSNPLLR